MSPPSQSIDTPHDALLFCDYLARFGSPDVAVYYVGIAKVIREMMRKIENQAVLVERAEAKGAQ